MTRKCSLKKQDGFTIVELLTSVLVIITIGTITIGIVTSSLRGSNKANTIEGIRQAGSYVLNQMAKDIEYSQSFDGKNTGFNFDGTSYLTSCPTDSLNTITIKTTKDILVTYDCHDTTLSANNSPLIDPNVNSAIALQDCSFTCTQNTTGVPIISISFSIGLKNQNNSIESSSSSARFGTSVSMRNYAR